MIVFSLMSTILASYVARFPCRGNNIWILQSSDHSNFNYEALNPGNQLWAFKTSSGLVSCAVNCFKDVRCSFLKLDHQVCKGYLEKGRASFQKKPTLKQGSFRKYQPTEQHVPYIRLHSSRIKLHESKKTWGDALKICQSEGATLLKIDSKKKNRLFTGKICKGRHTREAHLWIGLSDRYDNDTWFWTDGTRPGSYNNWLQGEPQNTFLGKKENCATTKYVFFFGSKWKDISCQHKFMFVCEMFNEK